MNFRDIFKELGAYNKKIWKKLVLIIILVLYFTFLMWYNIFRFSDILSIGGATLRLSWRYGIIWSALSTIILVLAADILSFLLNRRK
jgi:hypothetical protein